MPYRECHVYEKLPTRPKIRQGATTGEKKSLQEDTFTLQLKCSVQIKSLSLRSRDSGISLILQVINNTRAISPMLNKVN